LFVDVDISLFCRLNDTTGQWPEQIISLIRIVLFYILII